MSKKRASRNKNKVLKSLKQKRKNYRTGGAYPNFEEELVGMGVPGRGRIVAGAPDPKPKGGVNETPITASDNVVTGSTETSGPIATPQVITRGMDGKDYPNPAAAEAANKKYIAEQSRRMGDVETGQGSDYVIQKQPQNDSIAPMPSTSENTSAKPKREDFAGGMGGQRKYVAALKAWNSSNSATAQNSVGTNEDTVEFVTVPLPGGGTARVPASTVAGGATPAKESPEVKIIPPPTFDPEDVDVTKVDRTNTKLGPAEQIGAQDQVEATLVTDPGKIDVTEGAVTKGKAPEELQAETVDATLVGDLAPTEAAQGAVSRDVEAGQATMTERAVAAERDAAQEEAAKADTVNYDISKGAIVPEVTFRDGVNVAPTPEAEAKTREAITGEPAEDGQAAQIIDTVGYEAAKRRKVTGEAARGGAASMIAEIGELPPEITAAVVEDPATVEAQIDDQPVEVRAAIAALPTEALVSSQMETLLAGMDDGKTPAWARPAVAAIEQRMAQRGLSASSVGRDALFNAIIQSALPMAQSNAQALQSRAAQNLSNQQQANLAQSTQDMQRRMANLSNRQTAASQTAQYAQQMSTLQSQFSQQAVLTTAQQQQQTRVQNLQNRQQSAVLNAQMQQSTNAQNLGNDQQMELANLQIANETERENMSAENQRRLAEMNIAADFLSKNAGFKQQMELANLSNEQQMQLANLTALNQASSENLSAAQQTELANLNSRMQTNLLQAKIAESMGVAQLNVDQQRAIQNASMFANVDLTKFNAAQQVELANSKFMQTMTMRDLDNRQQAALQNATLQAQMDISNASERTKASVANAQNYLQMDVANLSNRQQAIITDQQLKQQRMLSNQAAENAAKQFNASSQNQTNQFNQSMASQMEQFNASQINQMEQFNAAEQNKAAAMEANNALEVSRANAQLATQVDQFNAQTEFQRDQWNTANKQAVLQSNVEWRRSANLADTAAINAANQQNAQMAFNLSSAEQSFLWQNLRDEAAYIRQSYENEQQRKTTLYATALANEAGADKGSSTSRNLMDLANQFFKNI